VSSTTTAPLIAIDRPSTAAVRWEGEFVADPVELRGIATGSCTAREYLRFARVPFWTAAGPDQMLGDLRYDRNEGADFAEITPWSEPSGCPENVPPWRPPREDVLRMR
jgi:hypothetical protein